MYPQDDRHEFDDLLDENERLRTKVKELEAGLIKPAQVNNKGMFHRRAVFLDRDGTLVLAINRPDLPKKISAPFTKEELIFAPDARGTLKKINQLGFLRIMITNQPDVAHGYMTPDSWQQIHQSVIEHLDVDDYYMCRHRREDYCPMKKPSPLMLIIAADKWGIDLSQSFMVGDTKQDMETGKSVGCRTILIRTSYNRDAWNVADFRVEFLSHIINIINPS